MNLNADTELIVVAGSDTTAASLTMLFLNLATDPALVIPLRKETDDYFAASVTADATSLSKLKHMDAVINETLRLHPPVPGGVQRVTPPEGIRVGSVFIPGNTIVQVPLHTVLRGTLRYGCIAP
jgi:cytochrome P450